MLFVYSGNFLVEAEKDQYDQTRIQMGLTDELFAYPEAGAEFIAPEVILSYTNKGLSRLSKQYHHCIMNHICQENTSMQIVLSRSTAGKPHILISPETPS